jgi:hypothetical protein
MAHLRLVAGTDVRGVSRKGRRVQPVVASRAKPRLGLVSAPATPQFECEIRRSGAMRRPRGKAATTLRDEARTALRNLKPSGEKQTLAELRELMTRHVRGRRLASMTFWTPLYDDFCRQYESIGMSVATVYHKELENVELTCEVMWPDRLLTKYPELVLYESVLEYLSF